MLLVFKKHIIKINYGVKRIKICIITDISVSSHFSKNLTMFPNSYVSVLEGRNRFSGFYIHSAQKKERRT